MPPSETIISRPRNSLVSPPIFAVTPSRPTALEQQPGHQSLCDNVQIVAAPHGGREVADGRGSALLRPIAHRHAAVAIAKIGVHVGDEWNLPFLGKRMHRLGQRRPIRRFGAADRHRPRFAVQRAVEIEVIFKLAVIGQHVVPTPAGGAERLPFGIIVRRAAIGDHSHHRRTAAHDAALGKAHRGRVIPASPVHFKLGPEVGIVVIGARIGIEDVRRLGSRCCVAPCFEQQDAVGRTRRQPVRQHAARRAGADNDDIEIFRHFNSRIAADERQSALD